MNKWFRFKKFNLKQEQSAQRMSTDSMVLGAIAEQPDSMNILDIGTGTGVLALMMAQKHPDAMIDAVELDKASFEEAKGNFESSDWAYRLTAYHQSIQAFAKDDSLLYDLIVSNPPFFEPIQPDKGNNTEWPDQRRQDARTQTSLNFNELIDVVIRLLVNFGAFYVILPTSEEPDFIALAISKGLCISRRVAIAHSRNREPNRVVLGFTKQQHSYSNELLFLFDEEGNRSKEYQKLTADFHI